MLNGSAFLAMTGYPPRDSGVHCHAQRWFALRISARIDRCQW